MIYESGFISNPEEEKKLSDEEYQQKLADGQYKALLETLHSKFGIDISGEEVKYTSNEALRSSELLKLSRIAINYIKNGDTRNALKTINTLQYRFRGRVFKNDIKYFIELKNKIIRAERYFSIGEKHRKRRRYTKSRRWQRKARRTLGNKPIFYAYHKKYNKYSKKRYRSHQRNTKKSISYRETKPSEIKVYRAPEAEKLYFQLRKVSPSKKQ